MIVNPNEIENESFHFPTMKKINNLRRFLSQKELNEAYRIAGVKLSNIFPQAIVRTTHEIAFEKIFRSRAKFQIYNSFWIGSRCVDFFIPSIGYERSSEGLISESHIKYGHSKMKGLVIEIDGPIHDNDIKMRKDNNKDDALLSLGIGVLHIENISVHSSQTYSLLKRLNSLPKLTHRTKTTQLNRAKAYTALTILQFTWK